MAGYNYAAGMSNNAVAAYDDGLVPASKVKGVPSKLVSQFCCSEEWHHSSKFYNEVDFYDPEEVRATFGMGCGCVARGDECLHEVNEVAVAALAEYKAARAQKADARYFEHCAVHWTDFERSGKRWMAIPRAYRDATVRQKGAKIDILLSDGTTLTKMATGKNLTFVEGSVISALAWARRANKKAREAVARREAAAVEANRLREERAAEDERLRAEQEAIAEAKRLEAKERTLQNVGQNKFAPDKIAELTGTIFDPATPFDGVENAGYVRMRRCQFLVSQTDHPTVEDYARAAGVTVSELHRQRPDGFPRAIYSHVVQS